MSDEENIEEVGFTDELGRKQGLWVKRIKDGRIKETKWYKDGRWWGEYNQYLPNGSLYKTINYSNGRYNGVHKRFNQIGGERIEALYLENERIGETIEYFNE